MAGADTIERLRQYLRELSPPARSLLIGELERSLLGGEEVAMPQALSETRTTFEENAIGSQLNLFSF